MPCNDVTEVIEITLDTDDRIEDYALSKRTCGQGVGHRSLLVEWFKGRTADEVLDYDHERFLDENPAEEQIVEFLYLKHLFAVQAALEVLGGREPGGPEDACAAAEIRFDDGKLVIGGRIKVDILTDRIKSCGNCGSCGKAKKKRQAAKAQ